MGIPLGSSRKEITIIKKGATINKMEIKIEVINNCAILISKMTLNKSIIRIPGKKLMRLPKNKYRNS